MYYSEYGRNSDVTENEVVAYQRELKETKHSFGDMCMYFLEKIFSKIFLLTWGFLPAFTGGFY